MLLTSMHQLISDATSAGVLHEELQRGYEDVVLGRESTLPPLDLQYKEAAAQRRSRLDERRAELADFWCSRLAGAAPRIELRGAKPRPRVASLAGERMVRTVSPALADGIGALARANGVTEFVVAEAAIGSLLLTESGQQDIIIGTYSVGRGDSASESQIGCYINAIPLRFRSTREPMDALLRRTQQELLDAMRHEDYPYGAILADLGWQRGIESTPLFDVMIAYDDGEGQDTASTVAGATFEVRSLPRRAKEGDLHIAFVRWPDRLELAMTYGSDRFDSDAVAALLDRLVDMLAMMVADASPATAAGPEYSATEEAFRG